jgi:hypothetical protein
MRIKKAGSLTWTVFRGSSLQGRQQEEGDCMNRVKGLRLKVATVLPRKSSMNWIESICHRWGKK